MYNFYNTNQNEPLAIFLTFNPYDIFIQSNEFICYLVRQKLATILRVFCAFLYKCTEDSEGCGKKVRTAVNIVKDRADFSRLTGYLFCEDVLKVYQGTHSII